MNILQQIFSDHFEQIKYTLHLRKTEMHFKISRYGGLYVRHRKINRRLSRSIPREKYSFYRRNAGICTDTKKLRKKYMETSPEGMTSENIHCMSKDDLLDINYFLNEYNPFDNLFEEENFSILLIPITCYTGSHITKKKEYYADRL